MFAEELGNNKNRKRQEENKERRRKLKQRQQQLEKKGKEKKKIEVQEDTNVNKTSSVDATPRQSQSSNNVVDFVASVVSNKPSSVDIAAAQRQERHETQLLKSACIKIQKFYRSYRSNCCLIDEQTASLTKRLHDLQTLIDILQEKANTGYILPPQMVTYFCQQIIFLTRSIPYQRKKNQRPQISTKLRNTERDSKLVQKVFQCVLIPGLNSFDENVNPLALWVQSTEGKIRIRCMMRLALITATDPSVDDPTVQKFCIDFVMSTIYLRTRKDDDDYKNNVFLPIVGFCRPLVFTSDIAVKEKRPRSSSPQSLSSDSTTLDLISLLRNHLLYTTGGAPNPLNSVKLRENCISSKQREHADILFQMVISAMQYIEGLENNGVMIYKILMSRFFSEILTIPLLTWKISGASVKFLFSYKQNYVSQHKQQLFILSLIDAFTYFETNSIYAGDIESVLRQDIPLKLSGATTCVCLLSNMIQLCNLCVQLNGSHPERLDFEACATYFRFLAILVDAVPITTFSSGDSVVEWVADGAHSSPVILSPILLEHCRMLVTDRWVRNLFHCAINPNRLNTEQVLMKKNKKDIKMEKELTDVGGRSVASLAAIEARVDRKRSFWKSSAWARNLTKSFKLLSSNTKDGEKQYDLSNEIFAAQDSKLINTSSLSRKIASGKAQASTTILGSTDASNDELSSLSSVAYSTDLFKSLCRVYGIVLARWGGNGGADIVHPKLATRRGPKKIVASTSPEPFTRSLLSLLCFSTNFIRVSWAIIQSEEDVSLAFGNSPVEVTCIRPAVNNTQKEKCNDCLSIFYLFMESLSYQLVLTDDTEIHDLGKPIPLHQIRRCLITLKQLLYKACCTDHAALSKPDTKLQPNYFGLALIKASSKTMRDLYDRSSRRLICVPNFWIVEDLMETELRKCKTEHDFVRLLNTPVLRVCPFLVSFKRRLRLFERIVYTNRVKIQGENSTNPFNANPLKPGIPIRITRNRILEDGLLTMNNLGSDMRQRLSIQYYNEAGVRESGIDAGGLFKEFWSDLSAIAFDPNYALFRVTESNCMYPNPSSEAAHGTDHIGLFIFLGRILGKSLYESITVHPQFAHFFLSFLRGDYNYLRMFHDLSTVDSVLYTNLIFLKTYDGDSRDLCLSFTVSVDDFGETKDCPLCPNGEEMEVDNRNKHRYIGKFLILTEILYFL